MINAIVDFLIDVVQELFSWGGAISSIALWHCGAFVIPALVAYVFLLLFLPQNYSMNLLYVYGVIGAAVYWVWIKRVNRWISTLLDRY